jgi:Tfp pilus assembly PilM family ATPase
MPRTRNIVGLDLGTRNVRAVWMQMHGNTPRVVRVEALALPLDAPDAPQLIRTWLDKVGLSNSFCAIALSGGNTIFQPGRIPQADPRTPQQAAVMDLLQFNEMAGDSMRYAVHASTTPAEPGHTLYLLAMARPMVIERMMQAAHLLSLRPADLVPAAVALFNALEPLAGPHAQPWVYLDIGHQQTDMAIGLPTGLLFARSVPFGGRTFTEAVAQVSKLNPVQAEARKHGEGGLDDPTLGAALTATTDRWIAQINSCLGVYRSQFNGSAFAPSQIVLAGGGARLRGLAAHLAVQTRLPVILAVNLPGAAASPDVARWLGSAEIANGLAATALEAAPAHLSLLPEKLRDELVFKEKKGYWIATAIFGAMALGLFTVYGLSVLRHDRANIQAERERLRKCEGIVKQIKEIRERCDQIRSRGTPVTRILTGGPLARETLTLVANSIQTTDWITLFCDEASYLPPAPPAPLQKEPPKRSPCALFRDLRAGARPPVAPPPPAPTTLSGSTRPVFILEGYTPDPSLASVRELLARLRTAARIAKADLLADDRVLAPHALSAAEAALLPPYRRFVIQLEVNTP